MSSLVGKNTFGLPLVGKAFALYMGSWPAAAYAALGELARVKALTSDPPSPLTTEMTSFLVWK